MPINGTKPEVPNVQQAVIDALQSRKASLSPSQHTELDSNFDNGVTLPGTAAFMRVTDSNTTKVGSLLNLPAPASNTIFRAKSAAAVTHVIKIVASNGTPYYVMVSDAV